MSHTEPTDRQIQRARERLLAWTGIEADRALIENALARCEDAREELVENDYVAVQELRDAVAQILVGGSWPTDPEALGQVGEAARARGLAFTPVAERVSLTIDELDATRATLLDWYDLVCSDELITETFRNEPDVYADFVDCGRAVGNDTALRETFVHVITERLVGRSWPIYADPPEVANAFHAALEEAVKPGYFDLNPAPDALVRRAAKRRERGEIDGALELVGRVLADDPAHLHARFERGWALHARGDHAAALEGLDALLADSPDHLPALHLRGQVRAAAGRREDAIADLRRFIDLIEAPDEQGRRVVRRIRGLSRTALSEAKQKLEELERRP